MLKPVLQHMLERIGQPARGIEFEYLADIGLQAIRPAASLARAYFKTERGRALFAGLAAHSILPLEKLTTS